MQATIRTTPPQADQASMAMPKTRFRRCAQLFAARRSAGVGASEFPVVGCRPPLPRLAAVNRFEPSQSPADLARQQHTTVRYDIATRTFGLYLAAFQEWKIKLSLATVCHR